MLEVTESAVMADPARALDVLGRLHAMGVKLAVDDFGTGYSSMAYLKALPVDELKVDRSFVGQMASNTSDGVIVRSTIDLGHNLGLRVVAEGVETQEAWQELAALGCDTAQGYYLGRPMPATDLERWLGQPADHGSEPRQQHS
jgi:EAL domain-containing protein (putative c-di-GMP-specific phosphodiesterase class I)